MPAVDLCDRLKQVLLKGSTRLASLTNGFILIQGMIVRQGEEISEGALTAGRESLECKIYQVHQAV
jgi:hypothetical protein